MLQYKAPIMDIKFLIEDVFKFYSHYEKYPEFAEATPDLVDARTVLAAQAPAFYSGCLWSSPPPLLPQANNFEYGEISKFDCMDPWTYGPMDPWTHAADR